MKTWDSNRSRELYNIPVWGNGYFDINEQGHLVARPTRQTSGADIDMVELSERIRQLGLSFPVLVRFGGILRDRVDTLCRAFTEAKTTCGYQGNYTAVYPIKVNQNLSVLRQIIDHGESRVGLEAGSKPELMAVLALSRGPNAVVICNGYKDREYIRLALIGRALGMHVYIVIEKQSELELVINESRALNIKPLIGMRVRLSTIGKGKWQNTGGEKSKFGLSAAQSLDALARLREANMLDCLQLLHCHLGSQIANVRDIQGGMRECARYYAELSRLGANLCVVDVGGGLGIDYEGTRSRSFCSINYSVEEYAKTVVQALWEVCEENKLKHPDIVTESGRAMTAHHAVLIANVIDHESIPEYPDVTQTQDDEPLIIKEFRYGYESLIREGGSPIEVYHDATYRLGEVQSMYNHGALTLEQRAKAEQLYFAVCQYVRRTLQPDVRAHRDILDELKDKLADKYFCNFSVFQSLPDVWAIDQIFPIVPLGRLQEQPTRRGVVEDITCDSDGRIDYYVDREGIETALQLHELYPDTDYLLGIFLVGAYQEILGDMHNLFGDTNSVNVELEPNGGYRLVSPRHGDTVNAVLRHVQYDPSELLHVFRQKIEASRLPRERAEAFQNELIAAMEGYTYLEER